MGTILTRNDDIMFDAKNISMTDSGISLYNSWPRLGTVALSSSLWVQDPNNTSDYTQPITIQGNSTNINTTIYSKIDLQPDTTTLAALVGGHVRALYIVNEDGNLYAVAQNRAPTVDLTIQCTVTEVQI